MNCEIEFCGAFVLCSFHHFPTQVDGIYPDWSCFMGPISKPVSAREKHYTVMQAARRKDIERAFGALKIKFNILNVPSLTPDVTLMNRILRVCTILHNMVRFHAHEC